MAQLDAGARRRLDMSARDMLRAYRHGRLEDVGGVVDLLVLADPLALEDPVLVD